MTESIKLERSENDEGEDQLAKKAILARYYNYCYDTSSTEAKGIRAKI